MERACDRCSGEEIVRLVRAGDGAALDRITRCYGRHLLAVGQRVCGDGDSARDAVQDALLAAGQHLHQFRGEGSVEGWLVRMVANACRDRHRGRKNDPAWARPLDAAGDAPAADRPGPQDDAARAELAAALDAALRHLSPTDRAIVLLTQLDGWTSGEVARSLDLREEAVRARLSRARRALRDRLGALRSEWL